MVINFCWLVKLVWMLIIFFVCVINLGLIIVLIIFLLILIIDLFGKVIVFVFKLILLFISKKGFGGWGCILLIDVELKGIRFFYWGVRNFCIWFFWFGLVLMGICFGV